MIAAVEVFNYGNPRIVPTCQGNIFVPRTAKGSVSMELSRKAAAEINDFPMMEVKGSGADEPQEAPKIDYSKYMRKELVSLAASLGIVGFFTMTKVNLIKNLEEQK